MPGETESMMETHSKITPPPTTIMRSGTLDSFSAPVESMMRSFALSTGGTSTARLSTR